jgi:hypothetical protein
MMPESKKGGARVMFIARQQLGKQVPTATNEQATSEVFLSYNEGNGVFCWI